MRSHLFPVSVLLFSSFFLTAPGCGSSNINTRLATWAAEGFECPEGTEIESVDDPALGRWCEKDGEKHGREVWHHKNMVKAAEILWVNGKKHRLERWWRPQGLKHLQINWVEGQKHGLEIRWTQRGGFGQATCFVNNETIWSTANVVEAQTRTCIEPEKVVAEAPKKPETEAGAETNAEAGAETNAEAGAEKAPDTPTEGGADTKAPPKEETQEAQPPTENKP